MQALQNQGIVETRLVKGLLEYVDESTQDLVDGLGTSCGKTKLSFVWMHIPHTLEQSSPSTFRILRRSAFRRAHDECPCFESVAFAHKDQAYPLLAEAYSLA